MPLRASLHPGSPISPSCSALAWYSCWLGLSPWGESWKRTRVARTAALTRYRYAAQPIRNHTTKIFEILHPEGNTYLYNVRGALTNDFTINLNLMYFLFSSPYHRHILYINFNNKLVFHKMFIWVKIIDNEWDYILKDLIGISVHLKGSIRFKLLFMCVILLNTN